MEPIVIPAWQDIVRFSDEGPLPQILMSNDQARVLVAGLRAGQRIPVHPEALAVYHILEGTGWMTINGERHEIHAGTTLIAPDGAGRGMEAGSDLAFLAVRVAG